VILKVPGDKSISQRALIFAALAEGESRLSGLLPGADPASTAAALRALGAEIDPLPSDGGPVRVRGVGLAGLRRPSAELDLGNSGTGARLLMGVLAACPFDAVLTGDASLRSRPMKRVTEPLARMGARFEWLHAEGRLPVRVLGARLTPLEHALPVASAQVKSALLLAGLVSGASVSLTEPARSRDHTERMLRTVGATVVDRDVDGRWRVELGDPVPRRLPPLDYHVPGDFSSAAFLLVAGLLGLAGGELVIDGVGLNPTRTGFLGLVARMGARVEVEGGEDDGREPVGKIRVTPTRLRAIDVGEQDVVGAIDEIPALVALAVRAQGTTRITGARELRVKETDRIAALVQGLRALGAHAAELEDGLVVDGSERALEGTVDSHLDHRIAMAFGLLGALPGCDVRIVGSESVDVSFPTFWEALGALRGSGRARSVAHGDSAGGEAPRRGPVVTLDGPAGSGKSTTAREVARRLGFRHLDSGSLYRALTYALLRSGVPEPRWPTLDERDLARYDIRMQPLGALNFQLSLDGHALPDESLRAPDVTAHVSSVAGLPAVRAWLLERQREAGRHGNLVADGRDMGTVVFPDADVKVFLIAQLEERSRRRLRDHGVASPSAQEVTREAERLRVRDEQDTEREIAPLKRPPDAWVLDTTGLDFDAQVDAIVTRVRQALPETLRAVPAP
jgi:3-phosphoshikimate 1-carboxyvinyltransferase